MKHLLEDMKERTPRIPLPELTAEEKERLGERGGGYESRLRSVYMPGLVDGRSGTGRTRTGTGVGSSREPDVGMTLDYKFKVQLFWIVSRTNNCQYCLGHQESKLLRAGMVEDEIAALDSQWSAFTPAEQAAFAFARRFTYEPHLLSDADIAALRKHYTDLQILEMILSMAGNNSINRWKEGVGVPQSRSGGGFGRAENAPDHPQTYETPTSAKFTTAVTTVAPLVRDDNGKPTQKTVCQRPPLESPAEVAEALAAARKRTPRLPLVDEATARSLLPEDWPQGALPQWVRLLANFPRDGKSRILSQRTAEERGDLTPLLKAQVSWIIARQDRAWYAVGLAQERLKNLGWSDKQIHSLDGEWKTLTPVERSLFTVARKLAASPVVLTDDDVAEAVKLAGPRDVVQVISYTTNQAAFDRITEAAGLQLK
jgi:AhpD family alkylhydroperoxidase